jgi:hypothetical protein
LRAELDRIMGEAGSAAASGNASVVAPSTGKAVAARPAQTPGWRIKFVPGPDLLRHGNDPLRILRELATLGNLKVSVDAAGVPALSDLDPEICRLRWNLEVQGDIDRAAVHAVFEWAGKRMRSDHRACRRRARRRQRNVRARADAWCNVGPAGGGASRPGRRSLDAQRQPRWRVDSRQHREDRRAAEFGR